MGVRQNGGPPPKWCFFVWLLNLSNDLQGTPTIRFGVNNEVCAVLRLAFLRLVERQKPFFVVVLFSVSASQFGLTPYCFPNL